MTCSTRGPWFLRKHSPYIVLNGTVGKVVVGRGAASGNPDDPIHPMEELLVTNKCHASSNKKLFELN